MFWKCIQAPRCLFTYLSSILSALIKQTILTSCNDSNQILGLKNQTWKIKCITALNTQRIPVFEDSQQLEQKEYDSDMCKTNETEIRVYLRYIWETSFHTAMTCTNFFHDTFLFTQLDVNKVIEKCKPF